METASTSSIPPPSIASKDKFTPRNSVRTPVDRFSTRAKVSSQSHFAHLRPRGFPDAVAIARQWSCRSCRFRSKLCIVRSGLRPMPDTASKILRKIATRFALCWLRECCEVRLAERATNSELRFNRACPDCRIRITDTTRKLFHPEDIR